LPIETKEIRTYAQSLFELSRINPMEKPDLLAPTLFHEPWFLDLASGGEAQMVEESENGQTVARLPFVVRSTLGIRRLVAPALAHFLGPAVVEGDGSPNTRFLKRVELTRALIAKLPKAAHCRFKCHRGVTDVIPFQMEGFQTSVQFTHEIPPQNPDDVWVAMRSPRRTIIRGAEKECEVSLLADPTEFMDFYNRNLSARDRASILDTKICIDTIDACLQRKRGAIYAAHQKGVLTAAIFCAWDATAAYYLLTTRDPSSHSGAISLLTFRAIKDAMAKGLTFDLDGLSDEGGVAFFAGFGGSIAPRYIVSRSVAPFRLYQSLRSFAVRENPYA
jgi:hypothetical protein